MPFQLVIFDKDGTLIDFHSMWGGWVEELARRLGAASRRPVSEALFHAMGYDEASRRVLSEGKLAATPMAQLYDLTMDVMIEAGLPPKSAQAMVAHAWHAPDPVALARPCADLNALFTRLGERGLKIAIATTDDRSPTIATLAGLGLASFVDALVCADDGVPVKPAPDMVWDVCRAVGVDPAQAIVVGDTAADLQMGRAAGAGRVVGVLTGVSLAGDLTPLADVVMASVGKLMDVIS
jgi:phosphoglycolate phosphatase-like HAD superfamily hydrolase